MLAHGALMSLMSGSGSAVFSFFESKESAAKAAAELDTIAKTFIAELCRKSN
jgi:4-diphosphocytidyl-2C-methyl-D-erythritol kinase